MAAYTERLKYSFRMKQLSEIHILCTGVLDNSIILSQKEPLVKQVYRFLLYMGKALVNRMIKKNGEAVPAHSTLEGTRLGSPLSKSSSLGLLLNEKLHRSI